MPKIELKKLFIKLVIEMKDFIAFNLFIKSFKIVKVLIILRERERESTVAQTDNKKSS